MPSMPSPSQERNQTSESTPQALMIRRIGWAAFEIVTERGTRLILDPYFSGSEGAHAGLPESPFTPQDFASANLVLVTHAGYDHRGQALEIVKAGDALLVAGTALAGHAVKRAGIPLARIVLMVSGVEYRFQDAWIKAIPARHWSSMPSGSETLIDQPMSFMLITDAGSRIFCGGDNSISGDYKVWGELYQPDLALLGIGGLPVGAISLLAELPPSDAAVAAEWLGVKRIIPGHYPPNGPEPDQLVTALTNRKSKIQVVRLEFGESFLDAPAQQLRQGG
jgi:L-ascorbate metabolism protein UlaG (beta-lactamase superfamily)